MFHHIYIFLNPHDSTIQWYHNSNINREKNVDTNFTLLIQYTWENDCAQLFIIDIFIDFLFLQHK